MRPPLINDIEPNPGGSIPFSSGALREEAGFQFCRLPSFVRPLIHQSQHDSPNGFCPAASDRPFHTQHAKSESDHNHES